MGVLSLECRFPAVAMGISTLLPLGSLYYRTADVSFGGYVRVWVFFSVVVYVCLHILLTELIR